MTEFAAAVPAETAGRGSARVGGGVSDKAGRRCPDGRRVGSGQPPAQHKSIAGGCLFPAPAAIVPGQEPESRDEGVSRFAGIGSHLEAADAGEGHAGQVERSGRSGNAGTGSHLVAAGFSDKPRRSCDGDLTEPDGNAANETWQYVL